MNFNKIRLLGLETIDLSIFGARPSDPYLLKSVDGLGPPESTVMMSKGLYQDRNIPNRQIVLQVGLNPNYKLSQSAGDLRETLYGLLTPEDHDNLPMQLLNGETVVATANGYVSKIDPTLFGGSSDVQVTIDCDSPYLFGPNEQSFSFAANTPASIVNQGSAPSGFYMSIKMTGSYAAWTLTRGAEKLQFDSLDLMANDTLVIDTRPGSRTVYRLRAGVKATVFHKLSADSTWMMLRGGVNKFVGTGATYQITSVKYTPRYWGV